VNQRAFSMVAGVLFVLVAVIHALRIANGALVIVENVSIPMWVSWIPIVIAGYLAYEGIRLGRKAPSGR